MFNLPRLRERRRPLSDRVARARNEGVGVYLGEWAVDADEAGEFVADAVLTWCRETLGKTRRPWGIAQFDIALAGAGAYGARQTISLLGLAPGDLYPGDSVLAEIHRFLAGHDPVSHVAVALFSWGDATDAALST